MTQLFRELESVATYLGNLALAYPLHTFAVAIVAIAVVVVIRHPRISDYR
jgi:glycerol-3-phosphate acyltransferase PlsY